MDLKNARWAASRLLEGDYPEYLRSHEEVVMKARRSLFALTLALLVTLLFQASEAFAQKNKSPNNPINIDIVGTKPGVVAIAPASGWPVTVRLKGNNDIGIGIPQVYPAEFPYFGLKGFLVFSNPDGCFSWVYTAFQDTDPPCSSPFPFDEKWVEFSPDIDLPGLSAFNIGPLGGNQEIMVGGAPVTLLGPAVGDDITEDGYGFGHDDDLPGLVVLADRGLGIKYDDGFVKHSPLTARNLAGLGQSVSYLLNDKLPTSDSSQTGRAIIEWHMNVPHKLMGPFTLIDQCTGAVNVIAPGPPPIVECEGATSKVDGGPEPGVPLTDLVTTLRVFVVNVNKTGDFDATDALPQEPPIPIDELEDLNGDGIVSAKDAQVAGYTLLSDEQVIQVRVFQPLPVGYGDIDGNGYGLINAVIPGGAGGLTTRPR